MIITYQTFGFYFNDILVEFLTIYLREINL